jgi:hypothetical protein
VGDSKILFLNLLSAIKKHIEIMYHTLGNKNCVYQCFYALERYGKKRPWPDLIKYPGICLKGLRKATKMLGQDSQSLGRDFNL